MITNLVKFQNEKNIFLVVLRDPEHLTGLNKRRSVSVLFPCWLRAESFVFLLSSLIHKDGLEFASILTMREQY
jgi:hypothetical protein